MAKWIKVLEQWSGLISENDITLPLNQEKTLIPYKDLTTKSKIIYIPVGSYHNNTHVLEEKMEYGLIYFPFDPRTDDCCAYIYSTALVF